MTQLVFLGDIHNQDKAIVQSLDNSGVVTDQLKEGDIAVLLELDEEDIIPKNAYDDVLGILFESKDGNDDLNLVRDLMNRSDNSVYPFDAEGQMAGVERQDGQRGKIKALLKEADIKNKKIVFVIVGVAHLQNRTDINAWYPLQDTGQSAYPGVGTGEIKVGFPDNEGVNTFKP